MTKDLDQKIIELMDLFDDEQITTADKIDIPKPREDVQTIEAINRFVRDNPLGKAEGGRIEFSKGSNPKITKKITDSVNQYNKILTDAMVKKDISKIPSFLSYIKKKHPKLTNSTINNYISRNTVKVKPLSRDIEKRKLLNQLVDEANAKLKHTRWIDIEKKVTNFEGRKGSPRADTATYRDLIDKLDNIEDKYYKTFQNILDNPDEPLNLTFKKYPGADSGTDISRTSFLKKYLYEQVQAGTAANIKKGLDKHPFYSKNKQLIEKFAFYTGTGGDRTFEGKTFNEALQFGKDNAGGTVRFSEKGKIMKGPVEDIYNFALRSWDTSNRQQKPLSEQKIIFYDKKTNKPIKWGDVPRNKDGRKSLSKKDIYFKYTEDPTNTKWDIETVRSKGKASGLFDEVYDAFKAYQTLLTTDVDNPFGEGKVKFSEVIKTVAEKGYKKDPTKYGLAKDHILGVTNEPFRKIRIIPQRLNLVLKQIQDISGGSNKFKNNLTKELLSDFQGLKGDKFNQAVQNKVLNLAKDIDQGYIITDSGYKELGKKITGDVKKLRTYSPIEQAYIKYMAGEIPQYKAAQVLAISPKGPKLELKYNPKSSQVKGLATFIKNLNIPGLKCMLSEGINCNDPRAYEKAVNNLTEKTAQGDKTAAANLKKFTSKVATAGKFIRGALGPLAIATEVAMEGGIALNKTLNEGVPIKQAFADSLTNKYLLGPKLQIDKEAEIAKEMAKGEEFAMAKRGERMFLPQSATADAQRLKKREEEMKALYPQLDMVNLSNKEIDMMLADKGVYSPFTLGFGMQQRQPGIGDMRYNEDVAYDEIRDIFNKGAEEDIRRQQFQSIADAGGVANLAGGGIAGLSGGDPEGAMTRSMNPDSQGLQGLMKRGIKT